MSQPLTVSLQPTRGDTYKFDVTFSAPLASILKIWCTIREDYAKTDPDDSNAAAQVTLVGGGIVATGTRSVRVTFSAPQTAGLILDKYVHDIQLLTSDGEINTAQRGPVYVWPQVTVSTS